MASPEVASPEKPKPIIVRKLNQFTSGFADKKLLLNWDQLDFERKSSDVVRKPMSISKDFIVGMKFQKSRSQAKV